MRSSMLQTVSIMDRFLAAEQLRQGSMAVKPTNVDLNALLKSVAKALGYQAREHGIELIVEANKDVKIVSDRDVLMLILQNLLSNAIKYAGKGVVRVRAVPAQDGGTRISVIDEGPG